MKVSAESRRPFDLDDLASGALKAWAIVTGILGVWMLVSDDPTAFLAFVYWEVRLSIWLAIATLVLGVPLVQALHRHSSSSKSWVWALVGMLVFTSSGLLYSRVFQDDLALSDISILSALCGVFGATTFYFAKRQLSQNVGAADNSLERTRGR
jgi:hypothetical protein